MLKKHSQLFLSGIIASDSLAVLFSWFFAYWLRINLTWIPLSKGVPSFDVYLWTAIPVWIVFMINAKYFGLYKPLRGKSFSSEWVMLIKIVFFSGLMLFALAFFYRGDSFSRVIAAYFLILLAGLLTLTHWSIRIILIRLRKKGFNLRHVLILGVGELAQTLSEKLKLHPEYGFNIVGFLKQPEDIPIETLDKKNILGSISEISKIIQQFGIDQVFIAFPLHAQGKIEEVLDLLREETVTIKVVPDLMQFVNLQSGVEELDGLPIISISDTPLYGWNLVIKRAVDLVLSSIAILLLFPLMALIALIVKLESPGPVFYRQEREGLDRKVFDMLKFRSMRTDAETDTGPVWASKSDDRRTRIGTFLRTSSLDELPQLYNVFKGEMSLVGPRPERPVFINDFKKTIPHYMLRLKMKAGLTGWAQVNGWRGNTSLEKRIEYDLYYIRNWSLTFDIKILFMTLWKGFVNPHAY